MRVIPINVHMGAVIGNEHLSRTRSEKWWHGNGGTAEFPVALVTRRMTETGAIPAADFWLRNLEGKFESPRFSSPITMGDVYFFYDRALTGAPNLGWTKSKAVELCNCCERDRPRRSCAGHRRRRNRRLHHRERQGESDSQRCGRRPRQFPFKLPAPIVHPDGSDAGLRFVDIDEDGYDDVIFSNEKEYGLYLFDPVKKGWTRKVFAGKQGDGKSLPPFTIKGKDNGAWFHSRHLYVQNESTALLKDNVERRSFNELLANEEPKAKSPAASLKAIQDAARFRRRGNGLRAARAGPHRHRLGAGRQALGGRDGRLSARRRWQGQARRQGAQFLESTQERRQVRQDDRLPRRPRLPDGVMPWRKGVLITCAPDILFVENRWDGKAEQEDEAVHRLQRGQPAAPRQRPGAGAWTTGSTAPTATAAAR